MKVYASPVSPPEWSEYETGGRFDIVKMREVDDAYCERVRQWLKDHGYKHRLTGEIVHYPVADGSADYMIMNGTGMIHLALGDAYQIPDAHARGLRVSDIDADIKRAKAWAKLFADNAGKAGS